MTEVKTKLAKKGSTKLCSGVFSPFHMYMWKAVDGENSCKTQHRTEDASVITDTVTDTAGKVKLGWRWVAKQLAGSQVTVQLKAA